MATDISICSFNLYNFQYKGAKVYGKVVTQAAYREKLAWTQDQLRTINADVYAFQELWSRKALDDAFAHPDLAGKYQLVYLKHDLDDPWYGIAVAVAIRKPWRMKSGSKKLYKDFPFTNITKVDENDGEDDEIDLKINRFSRTIIRVDIEHADKPRIKPIRLYAAHLKAKLPTRVKRVTAKHRNALGAAISTIRRTAEAAAARWILTNQMKGSDTPVVFVGDLNDDPASNTLAIITEQPSLASSATGGDTALYSTLQLQQMKSFRDVYYTHEYNNHRDSLDHILVSREFFEYSSKARWRHLETKVWNDCLEDESRATGDHGLIKASFRAK